MGRKKRKNRAELYRCRIAHRSRLNQGLKFIKSAQNRPQSQGLRPFSTHTEVPHLSTHPTPPIPKFPKRGILKTYKKLLERPSQFEKVHKVLDENYFWKIFRIKKRKARNTPPVRACFQIFITNDFIKF